MNQAQEMSAEFRGRLDQLREHISVDPLSNPVRQLAHEISCRLEAGDLDKDDLIAVVKLLSDSAFEARAAALGRYVGIAEDQETENRLSCVVEAISTPMSDVHSFTHHWQTTRDVVVFTGHPTFILSGQQRSWLSNAAAGATRSLAEIDHKPDPSISLSDEHDAVLAAMTEASTSISSLHRTILELAQTRFPDGWRQMVPAPVMLATWVGYDLDGRNDIGWQEAIGHRLSEKLHRLEYYLDALDAVPANAGSNHVTALGERLRSAISHTAAALKELEHKPTDPADISRFANLLTTGQAKTTTTQDLRDLLDEAIAEAPDDAALALSVLRADMHVFKLGAGEVHFRLNAAQIRNAARQALDLDTEEDLFGRTALARVQELIDQTKPLEVNFASLAIERSTAVRLMITMAQILKHVDSEQPIRLLIAELENPVTILAAIYLARLFGIDDKVDICPLFETPRALDRSRRILDVLFRQPAYQSYVKGRGRLAIQTGFSDAGRFMGQVPASLAIERLQGHMADLMDKHGLADLQAVVFNTHGESMGRGNHQKSFEDRTLYALSPWARKQFAQRGISLVHEDSFQGGDGYVLFGNRDIAVATITSMLEAHQAAAEINRHQDLFYEDISTSLDFYRSVKAKQESLYQDRAYQTTVSAIGLAFLPVTGSRKSKRQFDHQSASDPSLRKIRAIPHNAILQQMGFMANLIGGMGQALSAEPEYFSELIKTSDRFRRIMSLVARAKSLSEIKVFIAYMKLFDGSFWATRPLSGREPHLKHPCAVLAQQLSEDERYSSALRLAARMRSDSIALTERLGEMELRAADQFIPADLDILHAIRIAIIQHLFILCARLPDLAPYAGTTKEDILEMVFHLDISAAAELLDDLFPEDRLGMQDFDLKEPATYPEATTCQYDDIRKQFIEPLKDHAQTIQHITNSISHFYGAIG